MSYQVKLSAFEGPLDLLLHLITTKEVDIYDIPIATITEEYLRYLAQMEELDLDVAGEFIVMAATLIHIKSKMLLPEEETGEEGEEPDPRAELVARLVEYKRYKEAAEALATSEEIFSRLYAREEVSSEGEVEGPLTVTLVELLRAFRDLLEKAPPESALEITPELLSVEERMVFLLDRLDSGGPLAFSALFTERRRLHLIVTFLALLELIRRGLLHARQAEAGGEIVIYATGERSPTRE